MAPPQHLKPERLEFEPTDPDSRKKFAHWLRTFQTYANTLDEGASKLDCLINFVGHVPFAFIEKKTTYETAITALKQSYDKPVNVIFARHVLATRKQTPDESLDDYLRQLRFLAKDCGFVEVTAEVHHD